MSSRKLNRLCQGKACRDTKNLSKRARRLRGRVMFSKRDQQYLCATCRVNARGFGGEPFSHGKLKENRLWYSSMKEKTRHQKIIIPGENVSSMPGELLDKLRSSTLKVKEKLDAFLHWYRSTGRKPIEMTVEEFNAFSQLNADLFLEETRKMLQDKDLAQSEIKRIAEEEKV